MFEDDERKREKMDDDDYVQVKRYIFPLFSNTPRNRMLKKKEIKRHLAEESKRAFGRAHLKESGSTEQKNKEARDMMEFSSTVERGKSLLNG